MNKDWVFQVVGVEKVTDGDTFWLRLDVGFRQTQLTHLRLMDYDTPELYRPQSDFERDEARRARNFVIHWLDAYMDQGIRARTEKDPDAFGRWLVTLDVPHEDGVTSHLGQELQDLGLASLWPTRWREEFDA